MICKGNINGELGYGVIICENVIEWSALSEAILFQIIRLKKITRPEPEVWNFSEEIKILQKMYKELTLNQK